MDLGEELLLFGSFSGYLVVQNLLCKIPFSQFVLFAAMKEFEIFPKFVKMNYCLSLILPYFMSRSNPHTSPDI